jgi:hypothetical protein
MKALANWIIQKLVGLGDQVLDWMGRLPSTNARIVVSLTMVTLTGVEVLYRWTAPPWEWLVFLGSMLGLDFAQYTAKRVTHREPNGNGNGNGHEDNDAENRPPAAEG